jgi:hypothetical protein
VGDPRVELAARHALARLQHEDGPSDFWIHLDADALEKPDARISAAGIAGGLCGDPPL